MEELEVSSVGNDQDREAVPCDIVGVTGASGLKVGDTLYDPDGPPVVYPPIPTFSPERFAYLRNRDTSRYKQLRQGLAQLEEEGVVHVLRRRDLGDQQPILAGVGQLQFEGGTQVVDGTAGTVVLFDSEHALQWATQDYPDIEFSELGVVPQQTQTRAGAHV